MKVDSQSFYLKVQHLQSKTLCGQVMSVKKRTKMVSENRVEIEIWNGTHSKRKNDIIVEEEKSVQNLVCLHCNFLDITEWEISRTLMTKEKLSIIFPLNLYKLLKALLLLIWLFYILLVMTISTLVRVYIGKKIDATGKKSDRRSRKWEKLRETKCNLFFLFHCSTTQALFTHFFTLPSQTIWMALYKACEPVLNVQFLRH